MLKQKKNNWLGGSQTGNNVEYYFVGCDAVKSGRSSPATGWNILLCYLMPFRRSRRLRQCVPSRRRWTCARLDGVIPEGSPQSRRYSLARTRREDWRPSTDTGVSAVAIRRKRRRRTPGATPALPSRRSTTLEDGAHTSGVILLVVIFRICITWTQFSRSVRHFEKGPLQGPRRPIGLWEVAAPTVSRQLAHRWRWVVSLTRRPLALHPLAHNPIAICEPIVWNSSIQPFFCAYPQM
jgi:hypothetical protein